ncbi:hypothetical protein BDA96_08G007000 [Sorghum bicolor]|uniref:KIB1-4 beta-propeller domain-containing protein n=2 Tax=Sorghum bicolor TaxID=4558 RepID=A0A921U6N2_SORBI|nr:hypothetical protein SORBI_3008G006601 [Sorghum bicolor]KAG0519670.1 hypothetical protein BDA96_08G007000 [Sorghum bicolor]
MEEEHADDATKLGSSMSSCLPLLVFQHRYHGQEDDDEDVDNEMLMFSISQQSLHKNMGAWPSSHIIITEEHEISYHSRCMLSHKDPNHPGCVVVLFSYETPDFWYSHTAGDGGDNSSNNWRYYSQWLVEWQDQLFVVTIGFVAFNPNNIGGIEVHRMDFSSSTQDCWSRVHDIGDVVFLLEDANIAASACPASALGLKANQIFFMKNFMDDDGDLCIFDLETNSQEITQVHNRQDLILCRKPFWIVPPT